MKLRIAIWALVGALVVVLWSIYMCNEGNPAWEFVDSARPDLPDCPGTPLSHERLLCRPDECRHLCVDRHDCGDHARLLQQRLPAIHKLRSQQLKVC